MGRVPTAKTRQVTEESSQVDYEFALLLRYIGACLYEYRLEYGLSQKELAKLLGVPQCQISYLENGSLDIRMSTLFKLAVLFKTDPKEWLPSKEALGKISKQLGGWGVKRSGPGILKPKSH